MDKDKQEPPVSKAEPISSKDIANAHAAGDGALERSDENELSKEADQPKAEQETPY